MSLAFSETPANIRYHLVQLIRSQQVEVFRLPSTRKSNPRGRPVLHYRLARSGKPDGVPFLASAVLNAWYASQADPEQRHAALEAIANRLFIDMTSATNVATRLNHLTEAMNTLDYQARWEAHHDGARLFLGNCPYARIIDQHPELCEVDRLAIEGKSQMQAHQVARFDCVNAPPFACQFHLSSRTHPHLQPDEQSSGTMNRNLMDKPGD
jgi:predicted ArsR family transcriptional regulator